MLALAVMWGGRRFRFFLALHAARLVDRGERLGEAGERVHIGRPRAFLRHPLDDRLAGFRQRRDDRLVEFGSPRPGAVVLGEQLEFAAADIERDVAPSFSGVPSTKLTTLVIFSVGRCVTIAIGAFRPDPAGSLFCGWPTR